MHVQVRAQAEVQWHSYIAAPAQSTPQRRQLRRNKNTPGTIITRASLHIDLVPEIRPKPYTSLKYGRDAEKSRLPLSHLRLNQHSLCAHLPSKRTCHNRAGAFVCYQSRIWSKLRMSNDLVMLAMSDAKPEVLQNEVVLPSTGVRLQVQVSCYQPLDDRLDIDAAY